MNLNKSIKHIKDFLIYMIVRLLEEFDLEWTLNSTAYKSYIGHGQSKEKLEMDSYELHGCY
ncbi:MAG: hypothetical protein ACK5KN_08785 [Dysgonomonas sp.]|jgi:hypothetical protein|uniref:hypothetical protein n=1 Tax=unclassified Dysgonomonas TaxID=2630389 RepID=UPI0025C2990A|nr:MULTISPECIES: hypothetical protein [unclassified Dysgonomonas]MDR1717933.1 hypothetical protein [Prevotella sp.]MDR2001787.1 hypothetical protein [Prevotella sp.]HMM02652.1 hypothetical protein [Dysgonomonas sp.]